jgi:hypothetical protein
MYFAPATIDGEQTYPGLQPSPTEQLIGRYDVSLHVQVEDVFKNAGVL